MSDFEYKPYGRRLCLADYGQTRRHPQNRKCITHCRQRRTEPRRQLTRTENFVKSAGHVAYGICNTDTDRQTDRHAHRNISGDEVKKLDKQTTSWLLLILCFFVLVNSRTSLCYVIITSFPLHVSGTGQVVTQHSTHSISTQRRRLTCAQKLTYS